MIMAIYFNDIKKQKFQKPCGLQDFKILQPRGIFCSIGYRATDKVEHFLHNNMTQVIVIFPQHAQVRQWPTYSIFIVNIMAADVLAMKGARASATRTLTKSNQDNSVPARYHNHDNYSHF